MSVPQALPYKKGLNVLNQFNIDAVNEYLVSKIPVPKRDFTASPRLMVIRSFDVNKPGADIDELKGGVAGGSILTGVLKLGDEIEIRPGIVSKDENGKIQCRPIRSRVVSLFAEHNDLQFAVPGGLIGVGTRIDPTLTRYVLNFILQVYVQLLTWSLLQSRSVRFLPGPHPTMKSADPFDGSLVGFVLGLKGQLPSIYVDLEINFFLLRRLLGVKSADGKQQKIAKLGTSASPPTSAAFPGRTKMRYRITTNAHSRAAKNEVLMVNIGSVATGAKVIGVKGDAAKISLTQPACTEIGEKIALSRRIEKHWRLIG